MSRKAPSKCIQYFWMKVCSCIGFTGWPSGVRGGGVLRSTLSEEKRKKSINTEVVYVYFGEYLPWRSGRRMHRYRGIRDSWNKI